MKNQKDMTNKDMEKEIKEILQIRYGNMQNPYRDAIVKDVLALLQSAIHKTEKRMIEELIKELKWHREHQDRAKGMSTEQMNAFLEGLIYAIVLLHHPDGEIEWTHIKDKIVDITSVNHSKQG